MQVRKLVTGYFTTENNILGKSTVEIERLLGLPIGRLDAGAAVWVLQHPPALAEFETLGSTLVPGGDGLVRERLAATKALPGAWHARRLVRVESTRRHVDGDVYPRALGIAAEQWRLVRPVWATLAQELRPGDRYQGRRRS